VRTVIVPLNPLKTAVPAEVATAAKESSVDAFHLAALVSAGLLIAGAAVSGVGLGAGRAAAGASRRAAAGGTGQAAARLD
jgi:hypothetical protein